MDFFLHITGSLTVCGSHFQSLKNKLPRAKPVMISYKTVKMVNGQKKEAHTSVCPYITYVYVSKYDMY